MRTIEQSHSQTDAYGSVDLPHKLGDSWSLKSTYVRSGSLGLNHTAEAEVTCYPQHHMGSQLLLLHITLGLLGQELCYLATWPKLRDCVLPIWKRLGKESAHPRNVIKEVAIQRASRIHSEGWFHHGKFDPRLYLCC